MSIRSIVSGFSDPVKFYIKIGIAVAFVGFLVGIYAWHKLEIRSAVKQAEAVMQRDIAVGALKLKDREFEAGKGISKRVELIIKEKDDEIKIANAKSTALANTIAGMYKQSSSPHKGSATPGSRDAEVTSERITVQLSRQNADNLEILASDAERMRLSLLACYKQYDEVRDSLQRFVNENK
jgi:hypothetical protein